MADYSVSITVPDGKTAELVDALRWHYGQKEDGSEYSAAELKTKLDDGFRQALADIYLRHKRYLKTQEAVDGDLSVTA